MNISSLMLKSGEHFGKIIPALGHLMSVANRETNGFGVSQFWDLDWHSKHENLGQKVSQNAGFRKSSQPRQGDTGLKHWPGCETMAPRAPETGVSPPWPQFHCWAARPVAAAGDGTGIPPAVPLEADGFQQL